MGSEYIRFFESVFDRRGRVLQKTFRFLSTPVFAVHLKITVLTVSFVYATNLILHLPGTMTIVRKSFPYFY